VAGEDVVDEEFQAGWEIAGLLVGVAELLFFLDF
jgi:hypothetical protein